MQSLGEILIFQLALIQYSLYIRQKPDTEGKETGSNEHHDPHKTIESQPR